MLDTSPSSDVIEKYLHPVCDFSFSTLFLTAEILFIISILVYVLPKQAQFLILIVILSISSFIGQAFGIISKKSLPKPKSSRYCLNIF